MHPTPDTHRIAGGRATSSSVLKPPTLSFIPVVSCLLSEVRVKVQPSYYSTEDKLRVHSWGLNNGWPKVSPRSSRDSRALSSGGVTMVVLPHWAVFPQSCPAWQTLNLSKVGLCVISPKGFPEVLRPNWDIALRSVEVKFVSSPLAWTMSIRGTDSYALLCPSKLVA